VRVNDWPELCLFPNTCDVDVGIGTRVIAPSSRSVEFDIIISGPSGLGESGKSRVGKGNEKQKRKARNRSYHRYKNAVVGVEKNSRVCRANVRIYAGKRVQIQAIAENTLTVASDTPYIMKPAGVRPHPWLVLADWYVVCH
jgi:hypothetical protein